MRIGIDAHNLEGRRTGVARYLISLLNEWRRLPTPQAEFFLYFKDRIPGDLNLPDFFHLRRTDARWAQKSTAFFMHFALPELAYEDRVDMLFCPAYIAPLFYKGAVALVLHDIVYQARPELYNWPSFWDKILLKRASKKSAKKAKVILTCSEFSRREIARHYAAKDKTVVIPLAADSSFRPLEDRRLLFEASRKYNLPEKFLLFVGSIFRRRHLPEVIEAFSRVAEELERSYHFVMVGDNCTDVDIDQLIREKNVQLGYEAIRHTRLVGNDLPLVYNLAFSFIYLSDYEGFGLPVLEAMACGTPVITSVLGSLPEVAGQAALNVRDNTDVREIEQAIRRMLTNENLRRELIGRGLRQAEKFSWQRCARATLGALLS